jgi:hypothetical protein
MNIFRLTVMKFCILFFIPLRVHSQSTEIYTDLRGNKYAAINYKGMVKYKVEDRSKNTNFRSYINTIQIISPKRKKMKAVIMSLYTERHGIQRGKKKEEVTGRCQVIFSFRLIL